MEEPVEEHVLCRVDQLVDGRGRPARAGGQYLAVFLAAGEIYVLDNTCLHLESPIDGGPVVDNERVHCPWHGWAYELKTGNLLTAAGPRPGLRVHRHRVEDGWVKVVLASDRPN